MNRLLKCKYLITVSFGRFYYARSGLILPKTCILTATSKSMSGSGHYVCS